MDLRSLPLADRLPGVSAPTAGLVVEVDLSHGLITQAPSDPLTALRQRNTPSLADVLAGLRHAASDERVVAVVVLCSDDVASTHAEEIGAGLGAVRAAGKATYAFAESYGETGAGTVPFGLAARCEEVWLQPSGQVGVTGLAATMMVVGGAFERLGVEPQFGQRREYKTAAELFSASAVSEANREMTTRLARSATDEILAVIGDRRGIEPAELAALVDRAPLSAADAKEARLVDRLGYRDELYDAIRERHGEIELQFAHRFARRAAKRTPVENMRRRSAPRIAVVPVHGPILSGRSRQGGPLGRSAAGSDTVVAALRGARESDRVKAVVLHVDSPGGSAVASDAIRREVLRLAEAGTPVVASMGAVAASGGYFVAMGASRIFALPTTITGSIGVLAGKFVLTALAERLGIVREVVATGENAAMFAPDTRFTEAQRARLEAWLDEIYEDFTRKAATDRGMEWEELEKLARGRVWTGADAVGHGLVDALGGREAAVAHACGLVGVGRADADVVPWPPLGLVDRLKPAESSHAPGAAVTRAAPAGPEAWFGALRDAAGVPTGALSLPWPIEWR
jgi:protease-4